MTTGAPGPPGSAAADPERGGKNAGYVWHRTGEPLFAALTVVVLMAEGCMLGLLVWALLFGSNGGEAGSLGLGSILVGSVALTTVLLAGVTAAVVLVRASTTRRDDRRSPAIAAWLDRWQAVVAGTEPCPQPPIDDDALEALLEVRESSGAEHAGPVTDAMHCSGADRMLVDRLDALNGSATSRSGNRGTRRRLGRSLDTLDDLARARLPEAVDPLLTLLDGPGEALRPMAIRAVARSIAATPPDERQSVAVLGLLRRLRRSDVPRGELDEAIVLLEGAAPALVSAVLTEDSDRPTLLASCLDSVARLDLQSVAPLAVHYLGPDRPTEVRAAAFRAVAHLEQPPPEVLPRVLDGLTDREEATRAQAARAARRLLAVDAVPALVDALGDRSWWVRRAAAETLSAIPDEGAMALADAAAHHPDRYGRDMAAQVVRDRRVGVAVAAPAGGRPA